MTTPVYRDENRFFIVGEFNKDMEAGVVSHLRKEIETQAAKKDGLIELNISSNGGNAYVLIQIVELVELAKRKGVKVRTIVTSHAYSCGSMLAVTGTEGERYISRYAEHLVHYGQFDGYRKSTPLQIERDAERSGAGRVRSSPITSGTATSRTLPSGSRTTPSGYPLMTRSSGASQTNTQTN